LDDVFDYVEHYHALAQSAADDDYGCFGVCEGVVDDFEGDGCGFSRLSCPAGYYAFARAVEQCGLVREQVEPYNGFCEQRGVVSEFVSKIGEWF